MSEFETTLTEQTYHPPVSRYRFPALGSTVTAGYDVSNIDVL